MRDLFKGDLFPHSGSLDKSSDMTQPLVRARCLVRGGEGGGGGTRREERGPGSLLRAAGITVSDQNLLAAQEIVAELMVD
jgi:hypothetical protein